MAQMPTLSSYPSAQAVVFLDFDGHTVEGTSWNGNGPVVCNGANLNGAQITEIFNRVAEDYRPFNINITTDSTQYWAAPATQRTRVVLTTSSSWYGSAGGVAYTNSFTWGDNTPCFVFTALLKYNVKFISEATSHEAGHTLGLNHQSSYDAICNKTAEYNAGAGAGEIGWAPIMGVGYYRNQTLWHYGSNPFGCNYMQDDLDVITRAANGFGFRADDHGNTTASASVAAITNNHFAVTGVIEKPNDSDLVKFTLPHRANFKLNALPFSVAAGDDGANVDLQVALLNGNDTNAIIYNPPAALKVAMDTVLDPGTYYLRVRGTGNQYAPDFASLGSYTLEGNFVSVTLPVHKLELIGTTENGRHKLEWEVVADEAMVDQTVEVSADGNLFQPLANVASSARSFSYQPTTDAPLYYRMNVVFDNSRRTYSNVVTLPGEEENNAAPLLASNTTTSGSLAVNSPSAFAYTVHDMSGRVLAKGQLKTGSNVVSTGYLANGLYIIRFANGQKQYAKKIMKQ